MKNLLFTNLSDHAQSVFESQDQLDGFRRLSYDLAMNNVILDENGKDMNKKVAEKIHLGFIRDLLGIDENSTRRDRKRALRKHKDEFFEVTEETIDIAVEKGFHESEFFNEFVEDRNIARGDRVEFWTDDEVYLSVVQVAGDHHDVTVQRLGRGTAITPKMNVYTIAVGADIDLYLAGRLDWSKFTSTCAEAFVLKIQNDIYATVMGIGTSLPAQFLGTGALAVGTKDAFDQLIEDVETANGTPVIIMGTKTALKKINALADVDWATMAQKESMEKFGRLGTYEGTVLMEIPQRFALDADFTLGGAAAVTANGADVLAAANRLVASDKLLIMPRIENKFVKFIDGGETEITEITEKAERMDDTMFYQVERRMGFATQIGRYFGVWTF